MVYFKSHQSDLQNWENTKLYSTFEATISNQVYFSNLLKDLDSGHEQFNELYLSD